MAIDLATQGLIARLFMEPGSPMTIQLAGRGEQVKTGFVGMDPGSFLILRVPAIQGVEQELYKGRELVVRFMSSGRIYGFRCSVVDRINRPKSLVFITYPDRVESVDLRKEPRVECFLPVVASLLGKAMPGAITDLSSRGCRLAFKGLEAEALERATSGDSVSIAFDLPGQGHVDGLAGTVRSVTRDGPRLHLGVELAQDGSAGQEAVARYIGTVLDLVDVGP